MNSIVEKIPFWKWWEGKRMQFNIGFFILTLVACCLYYIFIVPDNPYVSFRRLIIYLLRLSILSFLFVNIFYSVFSLISFIFYSVAKNTKSGYFLDNQVFWKALFFFQCLFALLILLIVFGGSPPFPYIYEFPEGFYYF